MESIESQLINKKSINKNLKTMERFVLFFENSDLEKQIIVELITHANIDTSGMNSMFAALLDSLEELNKVTSTLVTQKNTNLLILIDSKKDVCYIYIAEGSIRQIKTTIMGEISEAYRTMYDEELFISEFKDMRYLKNILIQDPILN